MNRTHRSFSVFFILLTALFLLVSSVAAAPREGPLVSLSASQSEFSASQDVLVSVTISNASRNSVRMLKWFTPAEGVEEPLFVVQRDGQPVSYIGAVYKRPAITGADYLTLKAGESLTRTVNLADFYDLSGSGQYQVSYSVASYNLFSEKSNSFKTRDMLTSATLSLKVDGRTARGKPSPTPTPLPGGNSFTACTVAQQTSLISARSGATNYSTNALSYLGGNNFTSPRYSTWFGAYTSTRYNTVQSHFNSITDAFKNAGITFNCGCKQNYYAYVYPTKPYEIFLCKVFWTAPLSGTDSKAGTLIHEMSHFNVVASTNDYVYGQVGAKNLASTNPDNAINNADNHEYFAENNPSLP